MRYKVCYDEGGSLAVPQVTTACGTTEYRMKKPILAHRRKHRTGFSGVHPFLLRTPKIEIPPLFINSSTVSMKGPIIGAAIAVLLVIAVICFTQGKDPAVANHLVECFSNLFAIK
jgi:hypothetical protein